MTKLHSIFKQFTPILSRLTSATSTDMTRLAVGDFAPLFHLHDQNGNEINLASRQNKGWTILYFYPRAGTPDCTAQACAFRDSIGTLHKHNAEIYGISTDKAESLLGFQRKYNLAFTLLSDPEAEVTKAYGVKMPILNFAKRWTFIIDPALIIRQINNEVDPAMDAQHVVEILQQLQSEPN